MGKLTDIFLFILCNDNPERKGERSNTGLCMEIRPPKPSMVFCRSGCLYARVLQSIAMNADTVGIIGKNLFDMLDISNTDRNVFTGL